jgi:hypothetical protein
MVDVAREAVARAVPGQLFLRPYPYKSAGRFLSVWFLLLQIAALGAVGVSPVISVSHLLAAHLP